MKRGRVSRQVRRRIAAMPDRFRSCPDGLSEAAINRLIGEVYAEIAIATAPRPTSRLMDATAAERAQRRAVRQTLASVVRALPATGPATGSATDFAAGSEVA
jgi:hypothetical protein